MPQTGCVAHHDRACHITGPCLLQGPVAPKPAAMVCELGWRQVQLTSPEWRPAALASSRPQPGPPGDCELGATPTLRMPQARLRGLAAPLWEWLAEQPSGSALPGSGHQAQRHSSSLTEPIAFRKLLRIGPSARILLSAQEPVVGSLLAATTVIGSSPAPLGACPLVSMATPLLSKHKGASFYEIIKPNFAVWVHIHSGGPGDTRDRARKWRASSDLTLRAGPSHSPDPFNSHCGMPPLKGLPCPVSLSHPSTCPSASPFILSSVFPGLCSPLSQASLVSRSAPLLVPSAHQRPQAAAWLT